MQEFVQIITLYDRQDERTIEKLSARYTDMELLKTNIKSLFGDDFCQKNIEGKRLLIKPNWVRHSIDDFDEICLRTNDNFLLAVLEVVLPHSPQIVTIGDAPVQGCIWDKLFSGDLLASIRNLSKKYNIPVVLKDFRRVTFNSLKNNLIRERFPISEYLIFDCGKESFLEPISSNTKDLFRVTCYNPDLLAKLHKPGVHKYCVSKEMFNADIILSLPKVKTHQKTGITAALKNIVGINGDKDYLPHHRIGGSGRGGDCYPGSNFLRYWAELAIDNANRKLGRSGYHIWQKLSSALWMLSLPKDVHQLAAGWYGNDTCWRMVLDINKLVIFGKPDGTFAKEPQRQLYSLCDGIIGGQGDGPLNPIPLPLGIIAFTNHSVLCDIALASLMGFDYKRIPMLKAAENISDLSKVVLKLNGNKISVSELRQHSIFTQPSPGWSKYLQQ